MMFPRDNVGMLHVGPCSHKEGKRSLMSLAQLQSRFYSLTAQMKATSIDDLSFSTHERRGYGERLLFAKVHDAENKLKRTTALFYCDLDPSSMFDSF